MLTEIRVTDLLVAKPRHEEVFGDVTGQHVGDESLIDCTHLLHLLALILRLRANLLVVKLIINTYRAAQSSGCHNSCVVSILHITILLAKRPTCSFQMKSCLALTSI